mmetsp:Transcript_31821/g.77556  ORF Transcript_31821/g.77556 Transcript_31821/m.77556 type:complete len:266 (+) Transcript_31821:1677-2474(+)
MGRDCGEPRTCTSMVWKHCDHGLVGRSLAQRGIRLIRPGHWRPALRPEHEGDRPVRDDNPSDGALARCPGIQPSDRRHGERPQRDQQHLRCHQLQQRRGGHPHARVLPWREAVQQRAERLPAEARVQKRADERPLGRLARGGQQHARSREDHGHLDEAGRVPLDYNQREFRQNVHVGVAVAVLRLAASSRGRKGSQGTDVACPGDMAPATQSAAAVLPYKSSRPEQGSTKCGSSHTERQEDCLAQRQKFKDRSAGGYRPQRIIKI